jgi:sulfur-carrier protein
MLKWIMAKMNFTSNLRRHVDCPSLEVAGIHLHQALAEAFEKNQRLKTYVLDDQGALRKHMRILIDGQAIRDREKFNDLIKPNSEIWVMQALSGG